jgi:hypothetical protein
MIVESLWANNRESVGAVTNPRPRRGVALENESKFVGAHASPQIGYETELNTRRRKRRRY